MTDRQGENLEMSSEDCWNLKGLEKRWMMGSGWAELHKEDDL